MGLSNWFGHSTYKAPAGKPSFSLTKTHSKLSFKRGVKTLKPFDRRKALALDSELRNQTKSHQSISQRQYLKSAYEKYGSKFKQKLKGQVFTSYQKENPVLAERARRRNIFAIQEERSKERKEGFSFAGPQFANSPKETQTTASRIGASAGQAAPRPTSREIERSIWRKTA